MASFKGCCKDLLRGLKVLMNYAYYIVSAQKMLAITIMLLVFYRCSNKPCDSLKMLFLSFH